MLKPRGGLHDPCTNAAELLPRRELTRHGRIGDVHEDEVPRGLRVAAAYSWRLLLIGALIFFALKLMARLEFVAIALFVGLVITALVGPLVNLLDKFLPRGSQLRWGCSS